MPRKFANVVPLDEYPRINNEGVITKPLAGCDYLVLSRRGTALLQLKGSRNVRQSWVGNRHTKEFVSVQPTPYVVFPNFHFVLFKFTKKMHFGLPLGKFVAIFLRNFRPKFFFLL